MVIGVVNQKGGTGKTTLAINLADGLVGQKQRVLLLDADPQESVVSWHAVRKNARFSIASLGDDDLANVVPAMRRHYDWILIDGPPSVAETTEAILGLSDLAIVPIGPSPLDIWSSKDIVAMICRTKALRNTFTVRLLVCKTIVGTRLSKDARSTVQGFGLKVFDTHVSQRIAFIESMIAGQSVLGYAPHSAAADEITRLCKEIGSTCRSGL